MGGLQEPWAHSPRGCAARHVQARLHVQNRTEQNQEACLFKEQCKDSPTFLFIRIKRNWVFQEEQLMTDTKSECSARG